MRPLPDAAIIHVPPSEAEALLIAAEQEPAYEDVAYYDPSLPLVLSHAVRNAQPAIFDRIITAIQRQINQPPYCVIVRGLRFDEAKRLYIALIRGLGEFMTPPFKEPRARFVHQISPSTDISLRGSIQSERLHTDGADYPEPPGFIAMVCHKPDPMGEGRSKLLTMDSIREEIETQLGQEQLALIENEAVPWKVVDHLGGEVIWRPILSKRHIRWRRYTIEAACEKNDIQLDGDVVQRLHLLDSIIEHTTQTIEFLLQQGDLMVADNLRTLHGRTGLSDHPQVSERMMHRSWIKSIGMEND